jgi:hypothetical protein
MSLRLFMAVPISAAGDSFAERTDLCCQYNFAVASYNLYYDHNCCSEKMINKLSYLILSYLILSYLILSYQFIAGGKICRRCLTPANSLSPVSLSPVNNLLAVLLKNCSPVSTTPPINFSLVSTTPAIRESCQY